MGGEVGEEAGVKLDPFISLGSNPQRSLQALDTTLRGGHGLPVGSLRIPVLKETAFGNKSTKVKRRPVRPLQCLSWPALSLAVQDASTGSHFVPVKAFQTGVGCGFH